MICLFLTKNNKFSLLLVLSLLFITNSYAQQARFSLGKSYFEQFEKQVYFSGNIHTSFKPLKKSDLNNGVSMFLEHSEKENWFKRKLFTEHFFIFKGDDYRVVASPIVNLSVGKEFVANKDTYVNTRGYVVEGNLGEKLSFYSSFVENQAVFPGYVNDYIIAEKVVPGQGYARSFKDDGFDYAMSSGYLAIKAAKNIDVEFGHGKHFIGDGYRSLLLSDNAFNYPYLKVQTSINKWQYTNLYSEFQDINSYLVDDVPGYDKTGYLKKYMSAHYLSINANHRLSFSLYQAVILENTKEAKNFNGNYLNPVALLLNTNFDDNAKENLLCGLNVKYKLPYNSYVYGQLVVDDFSRNNFQSDWWRNRFGYQLGAKVFDVLEVDNLTFQAEYNWVRPYTYASADPVQNYAHYNQPLAHPLGANFSELLFMSKYRRKGWVLSAKVIFATYGGAIAGDLTSYGNDVYLPTEAVKSPAIPTSTGRPSDFSEMYQGNLTVVSNSCVNLAYIINPLTNLKINAGISLRTLENDEGSLNNQFFNIGIVSDLFNHYYDY